MPRPSPLRTCLRLVLLAMLVFGMCLQPVLAAACDIEDVRSALDHDAGEAANAEHGERSGVPGDCCANPACGDCCLHATASLPAAPHTMAIVAPRACAMPLRVGFAPGDYPVDSRPPIRG